MSSARKAPTKLLRGVGVPAATHPETAGSIEFLAGWLDCSSRITDHNSPLARRLGADAVAFGRLTPPEDTVFVSYVSLHGKLSEVITIGGNDVRVPSVTSIPGLVVVDRLKPVAPRVSLLDEVDATAWRFRIGANIARCAGAGRVEPTRTVMHMGYRSLTELRILPIDDLPNISTHINSLSQPSTDNRPFRVAA